MSHRSCDGRAACSAATSPSSASTMAPTRILTQITVLALVATGAQAVCMHLPMPGSAEAKASPALTAAHRRMLGGANSLECADIGAQCGKINGNVL